VFSDEGTQDKYNDFHVGRGGFALAVPGDGAGVENYLLPGSTQRAITIG
jgi:hypothetical protein